MSIGLVRKFNFYYITKLCEPKNLSVNSEANCNFYADEPDEIGTFGNLNPRLEQVELIFIDMSMEQIQLMH